MAYVSSTPVEETVYTRTGRTLPLVTRDAIYERPLRYKRSLANLIMSSSRDRDFSVRVLRCRLRAANTLSQHRLLFLCLGEEARVRS